MMAEESSISLHLQRLRSANPIAAQRLWELFFERVARIAGGRLPRGLRRVADEEDIALSVLDTVFKRVRRGEFSDLADRHGLWQLLVTITERKANNLIRNEMRQKRGGGRLVDLSTLVSERDADQSGFEKMIASFVTPEFTACMKEECNRLLHVLDQEAKQIAIMKFEGFTNEEIALGLNRSLPTIERRLKVIRSLWSKMLR